MSRMADTRLRNPWRLGVLERPEPSIMFFAFVLNFVGEFLQAPFFHVHAAVARFGPGPRISMQARGV